MKGMDSQPKIQQKKGEPVSVHTVNLSALRHSEEEDFLDKLIAKNHEEGFEDPKIGLLREFIDMQDNPKNLRPDEVLTKQERVVLDELLLGGLTEKETAAIMGVSERSTRPSQLKKKVIKKLRTFFIRNEGMS